ncbi:hypothetical protein Tco_0755043 [Tanacetum coccineum]
MRIKESFNVTFDESLPKPKSSPSVEDDRINEPIVQDLNGLPSLQVNVLDEGYPISVKEARGHPIEQVIGELNERILSDDSHSNVELYLNDEEDARDNMIILQTPSEEIRTNMINSIKDLREENKDMFSSNNEAIKLMLAVATNMSCVIENDIGKEGSKDNLKE